MKRGSEPVIPETKQLKTYTLDRTAPGISHSQYILHIITIYQSARHYVPQALIVTNVSLKTSSLTTIHQFAITKELCKVEHIALCVYSLPPSTAANQADGLDIHLNQTRGHGVVLIPTLVVENMHRNSDLLRCLKWNWTDV